MASLVVLGGRFCCYSNALHILGDSLQFHFLEKKKKTNNKEPLILHIAKGYKSWILKWKYFFYRSGRPYASHKFKEICKDATSVWTLMNPLGFNGLFTAEVVEEHALFSKTAVANDALLPVSLRIQKQENETNQQQQRKSKVLSLTFCLLLCNHLPIPTPNQNELLHKNPITLWQQIDPQWVVGCDWILVPQNRY